MEEEDEEEEEDTEAEGEQHRSVGVGGNEWARDDKREEQTTMKERNREWNGKKKMMINSRDEAMRITYFSHHEF
jgi:hypothetical protein